jgi:hypothetical protein
LTPHFCQNCRKHGLFAVFQGFVAILRQERRAGRDSGRARARWREAAMVSAPQRSRNWLLPLSPFPERLSPMASLSPGPTPVGNGFRRNPLSPTSC